MLLSLSLSLPVSLAVPLLVCVGIHYTVVRVFVCYGGVDCRMVLE